VASAGPTCLEAQIRTRASAPQAPFDDKIQIIAPVHELQCPLRMEHRPERGGRPFVITLAPKNSPLSFFHQIPWDWMSSPTSLLTLTE
jgi:hypothetical protein